jgi:UPF0755 protein
MKVMSKGLKVFAVAWGKTRRWLKKKSWLSFLVATATLLFLIHFYIALFVPPSNEKVWKEVQVIEGMSFKAIAGELKKEGLIRYRGYFEIIGRLQGISRKVRVGYYGLNTKMTLWEVLDHLRKGSIIEYEVVVPEGYNLYQIGWTLSGTPLISAPHEFIDLVKNKAYVHALGIDADTLEGYLFPDTYRLPKDVTAADAVARMLANFDRRVTPAMRDKLAVQKRTLFQAVTLASIVERESAVAQERPVIASVYSNRLKTGMALDADPTVQYAMASAKKQAPWWPQLTQEDYRSAQSPYNTYLNPDLPPGPIASPGLSSIQAAIEPAQTNFYFFRASCNRDGTHLFSKTLEEHAAKACP